MPFKMRKIRGQDLYKVFNTETGEIKSHGSDKKEAKKQLRLLKSLEKKETLEGGISRNLNPNAPLVLPAGTILPEGFILPPNVTIEQDDGMGGFDFGAIGAFLQEENEQAGQQQQQQQQQQEEQLEGGMRRREPKIDPIPDILKRNNAYALAMGEVQDLLNDIDDGEHDRDELIGRLGVLEERWLNIARENDWGALIFNLETARLQLNIQIPEDIQLEGGIAPNPNNPNAQIFLPAGPIIPTEENREIMWDEVNDLLIDAEDDWDTEENLRARLFQLEERWLNLATNAGWQDELNVLVMARNEIDNPNTYYQQTPTGSDDDEPPVEGGGGGQSKVYSIDSDENLGRVNLQSRYKPRPRPRKSLTPEDFEKIRKILDRQAHRRYQDARRRRMYDDTGPDKVDEIRPIEGAGTRIIGSGLPADDMKDLLDASYEKRNYDVGDYTIDNELSDKRVKVYTDNKTGKVVSVHRGSADWRDWLDNYKLLTRGQMRSSSTYKEHKKKQDAIDAKYGRENQILLGHSRGGKYVDELNKSRPNQYEEAITYNKATNWTDIGRRNPKNQTDVRVSNDPVSALRFLQKGKKVTIKNKGWNPLSAHGIGKLSKLGNKLIGKGFNPKQARVKDMRDFLRDHHKVNGLRKAYGKVSKKDLVEEIKTLEGGYCGCDECDEKNEMVGGGFWENLYDIVNPPGSYEAWKQRAQQRRIDQATRDRINKLHQALQMRQYADTMERKAMDRERQEIKNALEYGEFETITSEEGEREQMSMEDRASRNIGREGKIEKEDPEWSVEGGKFSFKKLGKAIGEPFKIGKTNPFEFGYNLGHDKIAPALFGGAVGDGIIRPFFCRIGSKRVIQEELLKMIPSHSKYVEPFVGGGAIFWNRPVSDKSVINDIDKCLMEGYKLLKNASTDINKYKTPITQQEYSQLKKFDPRTLKTNPKALSLLKKFRDFATSKGGTKETQLLRILYKFCNTFGSKGVGKIFRLDRGINKLKKISEYKDRLKDTTIKSEDYRKVIKDEDGVNSFFFIDPPYEGSTGLYKEGGLNLEELRKSVDGIKGKFMVTLNDSPTVRRAFKGYKIKKIRVEGGAGGGGEAIGVKDRDEVIITNY